MSLLKDTDIITFGKYKGTALANVPAFYLLWLYDNRNNSPYNNAPLMEYIEENLDVLRQESNTR